MLPNQYFILRAIPCAGPIFICPCNAETIVGVVCFRHPFERQVQQPFAGEPVVKVAKPIKAVAFGKLGLLFHYVSNPKIIEPQICRQVRLIMTDVVWTRLCDINPFRESFSPPPIVFRNGMELRKEKTN